MTFTGVRIFHWYARVVFVSFPNAFFLQSNEVGLLSLGHNVHYEKSYTINRGPPEMAVACQSNMTALLGETALIIPGYECNSSVVSSDCDRLTSEYRLTQTAFSGDPYCIDTVGLPHPILDPCPRLYRHSFCGLATPPKSRRQRRLIGKLIGDNSRRRQQ